MTTDIPSLWADAEWAAALLNLLGDRIGGVHLRASPGPVRDYWLDRVEHFSEQSHLRKIPANIPEARLLGGIDLGATLQQGKPIAETGMLGECHERIVIAAMAERLPRNTVHHLCVALDEGQLSIARDGIDTQTAARITLIAADEGTEEEFVHSALSDRLGITVNLQPIGIHGVEDDIFERTHIERARALLDDIDLTEEHRVAIATLSLTLGVDSPRAALAAIQVACGAAALAGRREVDDSDIACALRLCLLPKAVKLPELAEPEPTPEPEPENDQPEEPEPPQTTEQMPSDEDRLLEAAMAQLPEGLLQQLQTRAAKVRQSSSGTSGAQHRHQQRGRPTGVFRGDHRRGGRVNILATLRAAAPWQPLRRQERGDPLRKLEIRREDIHLTRYQQRRESLTLFVVDASGSAAMQRLAEAKGAVELLLADCYVRRDQVALIAFRD